MQHSIFRSLLQTGTITAHNTSFTPRYSHFTVIWAFLGLFGRFFFGFRGHFVWSKTDPLFLFDFSMETWFERVVICRAETYSTQRYYRKSRHSRAHSVLLPKVRLLDRRETETQGEGAKKNGVGEKRSTGHWRAYFPTLAILFCFVLYTPSVMTSFPRFSFLLFTFFSRFVAPPPSFIPAFRLPSRARVFRLHQCLFWLLLLFFFQCSSSSFSKQARRLRSIHSRLTRKK